MAGRRRHGGRSSPQSGWGAVLLMVLAVASCAGPAARRDSADALAAAAGLMPGSVPAGPFELAVWQRPVRAPALTLYIEGDGLAWLDRAHPSPDPTPVEPVALRLAALDPAPAVAVLARPCQYRGAAVQPQPLCGDPRWWTERRFTAATLAAVDQAASILKERAGAGHLHLVGFSGGGALAALLAARRDDVASLRTVAGNLEPAWVNRLHGVETPPGTLSPAAQAGRLARVPQIHFSGLRDRVVPPGIAVDFAGALGAAGGSPSCIALERVEAGHTGGWAAAWPTLVARPLPVCGAR